LKGLISNERFFASLIHGNVYGGVPVQCQAYLVPHNSTYVKIGEHPMWFNTIAQLFYRKRKRADAFFLWLMINLQLIK